MSKAFEFLKNALQNQPILAYPDFNQPFSIHTDASVNGLGVTLNQIQEGKERVIAYASRSVNKEEKKWNYRVGVFNSHLGFENFSPLHSQSHYRSFDRSRNSYQFEQQAKQAHRTTWTVGPEVHCCHIINMYSKS